MPSAAPSTRRPDPTPGERHLRSIAVRSVDAEKRTVDVVASTPTEDSHGTVIEQDWQLDRFRRNPVVLWDHGGGWSATAELPLGRCTRCEVVGGQLEATIEFAPDDVNPRAGQALRAFASGFLRAVSVGFIAHSYRWEMREGREVLVLSDNELLELSVVPVGSNPDALARGATARAQSGDPSPKENVMTEEEKRLLEWGRRSMHLLDEQDPDAAEARLRGVLESAKGAEQDAEALAEARGQLADRKRAELVDGAIRDGKIPPRSEWSSELREAIEGYSVAPAEPGKRSPLEVYFASLTRRVPAAPAEKHAGDAKREGEVPRYARHIEPKYVERARAEKTARRRAPKDRD